MLKMFKPSLIILVAIVAGGFAFKALTPNRCSDIAPDAYIFVLTGDVRRIPYAKKLLKDFPNRKLYIIGVGGNFTPTDLNNQIFFETESKNTYENALAIKKIVVEKRLYHIAVITTEDHMNRSVRLIQHELPHTGITACSVPLDNMPVQMRIARWAQEYFKYIGTLLGLKTRG